LSKEWEEFVAGTTLKDAQRAEIASEIVTVVRSLWASNSKAGAPMIELMASARLATLTANALGLPVEIVKDKCKVGRRMVDAEKRFRLVAIADQDGKQFYDSFTPSVRRTFGGVAACGCGFGRRDAARHTDIAARWHDRLCARDCMA